MKKRLGKTRIRNVLLVFTACIITVAMVSLPAPNDGSAVVSTSIQASQTPHPRIDISGDAELEAFPNKTGSGTETDPYVISNLHINDSHPAIRLREISGHVIISNCVMERGGIACVEMDEITLQDSMIINVLGSFPIQITNVENGRITNCNITNCSLGLLVYGRDMVVENNTISLTGEGTGIEAGLGYFVIKKNDLYHCSIGIIGSGIGYVLFNRVFHCRDYGFIMYGECEGWYNMFQNCTVPIALAGQAGKGWFFSDDKFYGTVIDGQQSFILFDVFIYNKNLLFLTIASCLSIGILFPCYKKSKINKADLVKYSSILHFIAWILAFIGSTLSCSTTSLQTVFEVRLPSTLLYIGSITVIFLAPPINKVRTLKGKKKRVSGSG
ncbi:MAG: right-handed parallel beta-helix repeat-containing protein [Candidatus Hodarchaeota archaeon]